MAAYGLCVIGLCSFKGDNSVIVKPARCFFWVHSLKRKPTECYKVEYSPKNVGGIGFPDLGLPNYVGCCYGESLMKPTELSSQVLQGKYGG